MRRALVPALALALSCARDLEMPSSSPPQIDAVQLVGLEAQAPPVPLPVLAGELVAVRGGGFPADPALLEVQIGGVDAQVLDLAATRAVVRIPTLAALGPADLTVRAPVGFRTQTGAFRYDGDGQPSGQTKSDVSTSVALGFVSPVLPPPASGFPNLAVAIGAADSALLVVPSAGLAITTVPLGLVPTSATARAVLDPTPPYVDVQVLAAARGGEVSLGTAVIDSTGAVVRRVPALPLTSSVSVKACTSPEVMFTASGTGAIAQWVNATTGQRIASIDLTQVGSGQYTPVSGTNRSVPATIVGWAPWGASSVAFAAGAEIYTYAAGSTSDPVPLLMPNGVQTVSSQLTGGCGGAAPAFIYTLAAASVTVSPGPPPVVSTALAVSYNAGGSDWVAIVDMTAGTVKRARVPTATSLALVPDPPFAPTSWNALAAGASNLYRIVPLTSPDACATLVADAALPLSPTAAFLPTFGGMATVSDGTRVLATTQDFDIVTILPPSLTSAGSVLRVASYGGLELQQAQIGDVATPIVVAEHALTSSTLEALDTGSALLAVSLAGDHGSIALGGSGYGRGAVWLEPAAGGALAYTGDLTIATGGTAASGAAAAVTGFTAPICPDETVHIAGSRPIASGPDLVTQGPARSGQLGPDGVARWGPASSPVYAARGPTLDVYDLATAQLTCLAGTGSLDWSGCAPDATIPLGVPPLDVALAVGDRAVAARTLETDLTACTQATGFAAPTSCGTDLLCLRASCPPAKTLQLSRPGAAAASTVTLPTRPAGLAADVGGGFLVTLPCFATATPGATCFGASPVCSGFLAGAGGTNGALVLVAEDGSAVTCLAVMPGLNGPVEITPNGAEAWVIGHAAGLQLLSRMELQRRTDDGAIDPSRPAVRGAVEALGPATKATGAFPIGGVAFTPDGGTGIVTVPGQFQILLYQ